MAQAGPITDVTQRLFVDLKAKSEEVRVKAANDLYENVLAISRGMFVCLEFLVGGKERWTWGKLTLACRLAAGEVRRVLQCRQPTNRPARRYRRRCK